MEQATEAEAEADLGDGSTIPFGTTRYWDQRYLKDKEPFDWYARYDGLEAVLAAHAEDKDVEVLHVGCGTSTLGEDLCGAGFKYVMNLDISRACIIAQLERYEQLRNNKFMHGNACALEFPDETFDLVIAKATLDVIRCGEGALGNVRRCCGEVVRVLRPGGRFIAVSHAADLGEVLEQVVGWSLKTETLAKPQTDPRNPDGAVLHVYVATRDAAAARPSLALLKGAGKKLSSLGALGALRP